MSEPPKNPHGWYDDGDYTGSTGGGTGDGGGTTGDGGGTTGDGGGTTGDGGGTNLGGGTYDEDNGRGFTGDLAIVAYTGKYADLVNKPILKIIAFTGSYNDLIERPILKNVALTAKYNDLLEAPVLSTVATTGDYTDLINIPSSASVWSTTTEYGGVIVVNTNTITDALTRLKGGGGLHLTQGFSTVPRWCGAKRVRTCIRSTKKNAACVLHHGRHRYTRQHGD
jgi:hypothetical protein